MLNRFRDYITREPATRGGGGEGTKSSAETSKRGRQGRRILYCSKRVFQIVERVLKLAVW